MINSLLWTPLAFGLIGLFVPRRYTGWWATLGAAATLGIAIALLAGFDSGASGLQDTVDVNWIPGLGVDYSLGLDGLNVFLVLLTAVLWTAGTAFAAFREQERPHLFFLMMLLGETATLGSFVAQDLLLFVLFFDLMLVPFYFLFGVWGSDRENGKTASAATLKMIVYTLIGSLLMLVGAIATAIIAAQHGGQLTFSIAELAKHPVGEGSQRWIFWFFAAAFLVKMPAFLLHGWMPDAYRAAPLPALAVFSGVLAKVGAYGFLRVVLPLFPAATVEFQEVILIIALASILYGSVMAFTQTNVRLVAGYSSVAQLGFITAGIFALSADGSDGAVLQMVNHGLVVAPLFVIVAILAERSGTEDLREMGGMAMKAPVLAALFLIVTLATLAMPGSANFIGEFYILNSLFDSKIVFAFVAISGVAMSAYYALRLYQRTMHNRKRDGLLSREIDWRDGMVLAPLVLCILGLALYPQLILKRTESSVAQAVTAVEGPSGGGCQNTPARLPPSVLAGPPDGPPPPRNGAAVTFNAPHIDYAALSPVLALTVGLCIVLLSGVFKPLKRTAPALTLVVLATTAGLLIWRWDNPQDLITGALRIDDLAISISLIAVLTAAFAVLFSIREPATEEAGSGEYHALLLGSVLGMVLLAQATNLVTFFVALETLSIPLYILCATNLRREKSLESGLKYLIVGSLGSATLLYGMAFLYGGTGSTDFSGIAHGIAQKSVLSDPLILVGIGMAAVGLAFKTSIAPFHQWTPDVYEGAPTPITSFMAVATKAAAFAVFIRFFDVALAPQASEWQPALAVLAALSIVIGNVGALGQNSLKRLLGYSGIAQAGYILGGLVVASAAGVNAIVFYLAAYAFMNLAAFAVVIARERETIFGDHIDGMRGLGAERPQLAWPLTISMLGLAGLPATAGFIGKLYLIEALVEGDYTWLAVFIAVGTMISLAYYLRVVAAMWMRPDSEPAGAPAIAGASPEADPIDPEAGRRWHLVAPALLAAGAVIFFGVIPQPLVELAQHAGASLF